MSLQNKRLSPASTAFLDFTGIYWTSLDALYAAVACDAEFCRYEGSEDLTDYY